MERVNLQEGWRFAKANSNEWRQAKCRIRITVKMNMKQESFWQRIMSLKLIFVFQRSN